MTDDQNDELLLALYTAPLYDDGKFRACWLEVREWAEARSMQTDEATRLADGLQKRELITVSFPNKTHAWLTPEGVQYVEANRKASALEIARNQRIRFQILEILIDQRDRFSGLNIGAGEQVFTGSGVVSRTDFYRNMPMLVANGQVYEDYAIVEWFWRITPAGITELRIWRTKNSCLIEFHRLNALPKGSEQRRGLDFEKIMRDVIQAEGWQVEHNPPTKGEQHDLLVFRDREYYLVECKWWARKVDPGTIREFYARVTERVGVHGIFISLSGYTAQAQENARYRIDTRMILLFGPDEVECILNQDKTFTGLLDAKIKDVVTGKRIVVGVRQSH